MKCRKLTLQEVLNLEDGTKVWVEDTDKYYGNVLCSYEKDCKHLKDIYDYEFESYYTLEDYKDYGDRLTFYEWIEEETPLIKMAQEVCNLRGLDLTDDNIENIIKEFKEVK